MPVYDNLAGLKIQIPNATAPVAAVKRYQESANLYNEAITSWEEQPENYRDRICSARSNRAVAHAYLGELRAAVDDADRALKELDSAIAMEPALRVEALNNIAVVYLMDKRLTNAEDCLQRALALVDEQRMHAGRQVRSATLPPAIKAVLLYPQRQGR